MIISQLGDWNGPPAAELVAVLTLDQASNILSANDVALTLFGWEASALLGQNLKVLLKDDLGADPRALIEQAQPKGSGSPGPSSLRVVARRKNGTEFPASISILRWRSDTTGMRKEDTAPSPWTAVVRNIAVAEPRGSVVPRQANGDSVIQSDEELPQPAQEQEKLKAQIAALETELSQARQEREEEGAARKQLEGKVYDLTADREDLARQLAEQGEHEEALQKRSSDLAHQLEERTCLEAELRAQLAVAKADAERAQSALGEDAVLNRKFEEQAQIFSERLRSEQKEQDQLADEQLVALQQIRDDLSNKLTANKRALAASEQRIEELEQRLSEATDNFERAQAETANLTQAEARLVAAHQAQIETLQSERDGQAVAVKDAAERARRAEEELTSLRHERDELREKFTAEQSAAAECKRQTEVLGNQVRAYANDLEAIKVSQTQQAEALKESEAGWRDQLTATQAVAAKAEEALKAAVAQSRHLELNLVNLRNERHEIHDKFRQGLEAAAKSGKHIQELEKQLKEVSAGLKQAKAELKEKAAAHAQLESELQREKAGRQAAEEQLRATGQMSEEQQRIVASLLENARLLKSSLEDSELPSGLSSPGVVTPEQPQPGQHRRSDLANDKTDGQTKP